MTRGSRDRDHMVVRFTTICAISAYHTKVVSLNPTHELLQVSVVLSLYSGFLHQ